MGKLFGSVNGAGLASALAAHVLQMRSPRRWTIDLRFTVGDAAPLVRLSETAQCRRCCRMPPFEIVTGQGRWAAASAAMVNGTAVAVEWEGERPTGLRHAWQDYPDCLLYAADGPPALPFSVSLG